MVEFTITNAVAIAQCEWTLTQWEGVPVGSFGINNGQIANAIMNCPSSGLPSTGLIIETSYFTHVCMCSQCTIYILKFINIFQFVKNRTS